MRSFRRPLPFPAFAESLQSVRRARRQALEAAFPPWYVTLCDDHVEAFSIYVLVASVIVSAALFLPNLWMTVPQMWETHPWLARSIQWGSALVVFSFILIFMLMSPGIWLHKRYSRHPFRFAFDRKEAMAKALDPVDVTREALARHIGLMRLRRFEEGAFAMGYRALDAHERDRLSLTHELEALSASLAEARTHACVDGQILVRVTNTLVPDAEPLEMPIEDRYAELVERRAASR